MSTVLAFDEMIVKAKLRNRWRVGEKSKKENESALR
jgi:hypothetical protein